MNKINLLSRAIYNRIAAGEVIDRPYSAVKELVENSLDAGATEIEVYIEKGGKQLIKVVDNGFGIEREDLPRAVMPHATSKISSVEDLDEIKTLGFRGEALSSICSIARVDIISVTEGHEASSIHCEDGKASTPISAALVKGTVIVVRDLFFNTPARAKFMGADKKEEGDVTSFISRFILAKPNVTFKYYCDGKLVLQSFGDGLDEAIVQVYGPKIISSCIKINAQKDGISLHGFIGNQNFFKPNKTYQSVFLNGRYIVNNTIQTAINQSYAAYAMKRQYPFCVLNIEISPDNVDVNVHPSKADVRFIDGRAVFGAIYSILTGILDGTATAAEFVVDSVKRLPEIRSSMPIPEKKDVASSSETKVDNRRYDFSSTERTKSLFINNPKPIELNESVAGVPILSGSLNAFGRKISEINLPDYSPSSEIKLTVSDDKVPLSPYQRLSEAMLKKHKEAQQERIEYATLSYKGNLFNTYLIFQQGDDAYIVDQHAAHERVLFDKLRKQLSERTLLKQPLIAPYVFATTPKEACFLEENIRAIRSMGFTVEPKGDDMFCVVEVPFDFRDMDLKTFFDEIFSDIDNLGGTKIEDIFKEKIAQKACKAAVKGGHKLTQREIDELLVLIDGNFGLKCPHGRPICVKMTKQDVEKMFKRIL